MRGGAEQHVMSLAPKRQPRALARPWASRVCLTSWSRQNLTEAQSLLDAPPWAHSSSQDSKQRQRCVDAKNLTTTHAAHTHAQTTAGDVRAYRHRHSGRKIRQHASRQLRPGTSTRDPGHAERYVISKLRKASGKGPQKVRRHPGFSAPWQGAGEARAG